MLISFVNSDIFHTYGHTIYSRTWNKHVIVWTIIARVKSLTGTYTFAIDYQQHDIVIEWPPHSSSFGESQTRPLH